MLIRYLARPHYAASATTSGSRTNRIGGLILGGVLIRAPHDDHLAALFADIAHVRNAALTFGISPFVIRFRIRMSLIRRLGLECIGKRVFHRCASAGVVDRDFESQLCAVLVHGAVLAGGAYDFLLPEGFIGELIQRYRLRCVAGGALQRDAAFRRLGGRRYRLKLPLVLVRGADIDILVADGAMILRGMVAGRLFDRLAFRSMRAGHFDHDDLSASVTPKPCLALAQGSSPAVARKREERILGEVVGLGVIHHDFAVVVRCLADVHALEAVRGIIFGVFDVDDAVLVALLLLNFLNLEVVICAAQLGRSFFVAAPRAIDFEGEGVLLTVVLKLDEHIIVTASGAFLPPVFAAPVAVPYGIRRAAGGVTSVLF